LVPVDRAVWHLEGRFGDQDPTRRSLYSSVIANPRLIVGYPQRPTGVKKVAVEGRGREHSGEASSDARDRDGQLRWSGWITLRV
jgi:hypothetical protein